MSLSTEAIRALEVLVARVEELTGRPCDLLTRMVLTYAARDLVNGRVVCLRVNSRGIVVSLLRRKLATPQPTP
jgi:uncharacterized protein (DUF2252 family)